MRSPLAQTLLARLSSEAVRAALEADPNLDTRIERIVATARARFPKITQAPDAFVAHVADKLGDDAAALDRLLAADLFLAWACAAGDAGAIAALEAEYLPAVDVALARVGVPAAERDEAKQRVRDAVLVAPAGVAPKIAGYSGRGDLRAWLSVVAVRAARRSGKKRSRETGDEALARLPSLGDPELAYFEQHYRAEFKDAFATAMTALSRKERNVLRQSAIDGLSIDQLAAIYHVHRSTVARMVVRARETLLAEVRKILGERLELDESELESLERLVQSKLEVSLERYLRDPPKR